MHRYSIKDKPELALLLYCSRTSVESGDREYIRQLITPNMDWDWLVEMARRHGVAPLLYKNLKEHAPGLMPETTRLFLRNFYLRNSAHNLRLLHELRRLITAFEDLKIPMIPFKGAALAEIVYGSVALRKASSDLDIVVLKPDIFKAIDIIEKLGYRRSAKLWLDDLQNHIKYRYHLSFVGPHDFYLELHWHIVSKFMATFEMPELFDRRYYATSPDFSCSTFSPEDLWLLLCIHATKDSWLSLSHVCDLNELLNRYPDFDRMALLHKSKKEGYLRIVLMGFYLVKVLFSAPLPAAVEKEIDSDPKMRKLAAKMIEAMFSEHRYYGKRGLIPARYYLYIAMRERVRDKMLILWVKFVQLSKAFTFIHVGNIRLFFRRTVTKIVKRRTMNKA